MNDCCGPSSYDRIFGPGVARRAASRYARRGLGWAPARTVALLEEGVIRGETLLEVGGGIGDLQVELLRRGIAKAVAVDISSEYEVEAALLLQEAGLDGRVTRKTGDFVGMASQLAPADLVVMHSVVCCYPWPEALVGAAAAKTRRALVISYPKDTWWTRSFAAMQNAWYRHLRRTEFRFWVHPLATIHDTAANAGLELSWEGSAMVDCLAVYRRAR